ncbi:MAG: hypothetical protein ACYC2Y_04270 [Armatimonadota bacterium]
MNNGWFIAIVVICMVLCAGFVLVVTLLRAAWSRKEREALTSNDLRVLEESAFILIEQLRNEADQKISEVDRACARLSKLLDEADARLSALRELSVSRHEEPEAPSGGEQSELRQRVLSMAASGIDCAEIARKEGLGCAEVNLMLKLARSDSN